MHIPIHGFYIYNILQYIYICRMIWYIMVYIIYIHMTIEYHIYMYFKQIFRYSAKFIIYIYICTYMYNPVVELHPNMIYISHCCITHILRHRCHKALMSQWNSPWTLPRVRWRPARRDNARPEACSGLSTSPGIGSGLSTQFFDAWLSRPRQKMTHS